jgi:RNA methyltransferase, TrmH family
MISSIINQKIKDVIKLRDSSGRRKQGLFVFEGEREIKLALSCGFNIKELYVCRQLLREKGEEAVVIAREKKVKIYDVNVKVYERLAYGNKRDGLIAVADTPRYELADIRLKKNPLLVITEAIEKPGNLGAILRTIDACAVDSFIVSDTISDVYNHHVVRSSVGTVFAKPVVSASSEDIYAWLKKNNISIVCADPDGLSVYTSMDLKGPTAIVLGNEKKGVSCFWKENADFISFIPMKGRADSLNVSITAAAFIFEAIRQRS